MIWLCSAAKLGVVCNGSVLLHHFAQPKVSVLLSAVQEITLLSPFRHMITSGGYRMSVTMANCGQFGWTTDEKGYIYSLIVPLTRQHWQVIPDSFTKLVHGVLPLKAGFSFSIGAYCINLTFRQAK